MTILFVVLIVLTGLILMAWLAGMAGTVTAIQQREGEWDDNDS